MLNSFVSWCGGLPSPESSNNPFGYKFSWSPRGVLLAAMNPAVYKWNGKVVEIGSGGEILKNTHAPSIYPGFNFVGIPNRDSMKYIQHYGLDASQLNTMFRGTLRYGGFCELMVALKELGLLAQSKMSLPSPSSWVSIVLNVYSSRCLCFHQPAHCLCRETFCPFF